MREALQSGERDAVRTLLELGADPLIIDDLHGGNAHGWATHGGRADIAELLPPPPSPLPPDNAEPEPTRDKP
jgi:hypothetical protein